MIVNNIELKVLLERNSVSTLDHGFNLENPVLGRLGNLETRLIRSRKELEAAQSLRYEVFYNEMGAVPDVSVKQTGRDQDWFDDYCDHLLVIDTAVDPHYIVGTYRMMRPTQALKAGGYYTQKEYCIEPLLRANPTSRFLELGRSCVLRDYRNKRTMELLWHGTWSYAVANKIDIMFGCASFDGVDLRKFSGSLGWLARHVCMAVEENCESSAPNSIRLDSFECGDGDMKTAMSTMPALLKGYLRLGAKIGSHAVVDHQFGTTDVLVVLKVADINPRYLAHYGADASRFAT